MKCREFQKLIPDIIDDNIPENMLEEVIDHVENCKECYDELEIYYVLRYGLGDDDSDASMDFIGQLEGNIRYMKKRLKAYKDIRSLYIFSMLTAHTTVIGTLIYVIFKYFI